MSSEIAQSLAKLKKYVTFSVWSDFKQMQRHLNNRQQAEGHSFKTDVYLVGQCLFKASCLIRKLRLVLNWINWWAVGVHHLYPPYKVKPVYNSQTLDLRNWLLNTGDHSLQDHQNTHWGWSDVKFSGVSYKNTSCKEKWDNQHSFKRSILKQKCQNVVYITY